MSGPTTRAVEAWVRATKARMLAVRNESVMRVVGIMQTTVGAGGNMPVDTGALRASLTARVGRVSLPVTFASAPTVVGQMAVDPVTQRGDASGAVALVIASAKLSDSITLGWTMNYAGAVHYGTRGRVGRMWATLGAQQWPRIVSEVAREAYSRAGSGASR